MCIFFREYRYVKRENAVENSVENSVETYETTLCLAHDLKPHVLPSALPKDTEMIANIETEGYLN
jgi:hypothetical protein